MATATVQQVLSSHDEVQAAELLFTLLSEQAQGRDLSSVAAEVAQVSPDQSKVVLRGAAQRLRTG